MRISDWSSDVCSSDLCSRSRRSRATPRAFRRRSARPEPAPGPSGAGEQVRAMSSLVRNVGTIGGLTLVSRIFGFVRDMMLARVLGAGLAADAFPLAFLQIGRAACRVRVCTYV